ncbi:MAG: exodeoxyribonuclease VII small subunit [Eubacteriales bacterium]|nr:exodeoxyribonuclease VII small subunit [Eubacteriales bacterium]
MSNEQNTDKTMIKEMSIEEMFEELSELAKKLEDKTTTLEDSFVLYQRGMALLQECNVKLDAVEKKMLKLNEDGTTVEFSENIIR